MNTLSATSTSRILYTETEIRQRVRELGRELALHYEGKVPCCIGLMNGALFFLTDLLREIELEVEIHCVRLASYAGRESQGVVKGLEGIDALAQDVKGRFVLVVDDILDTGGTLMACLERLRSLGAVEVKTCVLLDKQRKRELKLSADWTGFKIADEFVVGYGLDFNGRYRGLKNIEVLTIDSPLK